MALLFLAPCTISTGEEFAFSKPHIRSGYQTVYNWPEDTFIIVPVSSQQPITHDLSLTFVQSLPSSPQFVDPNGFILTKKIIGLLGRCTYPHKDRPPAHLSSLSQISFCILTNYAVEFFCPGCSPPSYQLFLKPSGVSHQPYL